MTQEQLAHLRSCRFLKNRQEVDTFESTLAEISRLGNVTQGETEDLYRLLTDSSAQQDVLWGLLHLIEDFDQDIWLPAFVDVLPEMKAQSPEWADTITARILNGDGTRPVFQTLLREAPNSRGAILPILKDLSEDQHPRLQKLRKNAKELLEDLRQ
jgi:hypothetical protein